MEIGISDSTKKMMVFMFIAIVALILFLIGCRKTAVSTTIVNEYEYKNHNYIIFKKPGEFGTVVLHDPECIKKDEINTFD